ncbi:MAG: lipid-A-disaccharide synthase [Alphaproteobacteria bacterium]|nr:lipid-A-disaccharide synthase [Alphaproteobacteria bacterium]
MTAPVFFMVAGEPSGDLLGARLIAALKEQTGGAARFTGVGGERMVAEGLETIFPQSELAHVGLVEVLRHIPKLLRRIRQTADAVIKAQPAALITIDAPDFSFRVAKRVKARQQGHGFPLIHYVAPTVWAWRPGRARKIAGFLDHLLAVLPFEPPYFRHEGLGCTFVGHSIVEGGMEKGDAARFRATHAVSPGRTILVVLPGSRRSEITRMGPVFAETLSVLQKRHPDLLCVVPTLEQVAGQVRRAVEDWPVETIVVQGDEAKYDAFKAATAALACSGTVALELALAKLPAAITYRINPLTAFFIRRVIKVRFANLVNIMHGHEAVPEFIQEKCKPEKIAAALDTLLAEQAARQEQIAELDAVAAWLGQGENPPSARAARAVLDVVARHGVPPLAVMQVIPSLATGGAEQACVDINAALVAEGARSIVVSSGGKLVGAIEQAGGVHITLPVDSKNPLRILANAFALARFARRHDVGIIHARSRAPAWSAKMAARLAGRRFITTFHAAYKFSTPIKRFYNKVMAEGEAVIAISHMIARHIRSHYMAAHGRIVTITRGIDLDIFDPMHISATRVQAMRGGWGVADDKKIILMPARISRIKGHAVLIEAMEILKGEGKHSDAVAVMVGDDQGRRDYRDELENIIARKELGKQAVLAGHCDDIAAAYAAAELVVMPSIVPEGFGRVPVEAQAMGKPVIATDLGAVQETVVAGETGWLFPPHDARALALAIDHVLSLPRETKEQTAARAIAHVRAHYDKKKMCAATLDVYRKLAVNGS